MLWSRDYCRWLWSWEKLQRCQGGNQARRTWQAVTKEDKIFFPWDLDDNREIRTGLRIVKRKEKGAGAMTALKVPEAG